MQVRGFLINEVIKRAASIVNPHLITVEYPYIGKRLSGPSICLALSAISQDGELIRQINKGNPQVRLRATQVSE